MSVPIRVIVGDIILKGELFNTPCGQAVADALPVETRPDEWGDEFYFAVPVAMSLDDTATTQVKVGDIGYWPPGHALTIFFGPTPLSRGEEPIAASEVNVVGRITGDATVLRRAKGAASIRIERA
jgi:hypothetical protein